MNTNQTLAIVGLVGIGGYLLYSQMNKAEAAPKGDKEAAKGDKETSFRKAEVPEPPAWTPYVPVKPVEIPRPTQIGNGRNVLMVDLQNDGKNEQAKMFWKETSDAMSYGEVYQVYLKWYSSAPKGQKPTPVPTAPPTGNNRAFYHSDLVNMGYKKAAAAFLSVTNDSMTSDQIYDAYTKAYTSGSAPASGSVIGGSEILPDKETSYRKGESDSSRRSWLDWLP